MIALRNKYFFIGLKLKKSFSEACVIKKKETRNLIRAVDKTFCYFKSGKSLQNEKSIQSDLWQVV